MSSNHISSSVAGDFKGHVRQYPKRFLRVHGSYGFALRKEEGTRLLEFSDANDLLISNINIRKLSTHLINYKIVGPQAGLTTLIPEYLKQG